VKIKSNMSINETIEDNLSESLDDDIRELMESHDLDKETAERVQEIMDECGVDEDDAVEIMEAE